MSTNMLGYEGRSVILFDSMLNKPATDGILR